MDYVTTISVYVNGFWKDLDLFPDTSQSIISLNLLFYCTTKAIGAARTSPEGPIPRMPVMVILAPGLN